MNFFPKALLLIASLMVPASHVAASPRISNRAGEVPLTYLPALKGDYFRLDSEVVGRAFHVYVRYPADYETRPDRQYPVVYLLDGDSLFPLLATHHLFLTYDERLPEAIVVGIAYGGFEPEVNRRTIDFAAPGPGIPASESGAPAFLQFLETELLPAVEERYRADPRHRILVGQSFGGSFVLYSAFARPDLFWGRIASNPALGGNWDFLSGEPAAASRDDLALVVASGTRDRPHFLQRTTEWLEEWEGRTDKPWTLHVERIEGGTHAAHITDAYRAGMLRLFGSLPRTHAPGPAERSLPAGH